MQPLPAAYQELAKLVLSNMDKLENKVDAAITKPSRARGGGCDWHDRRGGQWSRGGRGRSDCSDRGSHGRFSYGVLINGVDGHYSSHIVPCTNSLSTRVSAFISLALVVVLVVQNNNYTISNFNRIRLYLTQIIILKLIIIDSVPFWNMGVSDI